MPVTTDRILALLQEMLEPRKGHERAVLECATERIRELDSLVRTIPPNYSEHMKHCVCDWCQRFGMLT